MKKVFSIIFLITGIISLGAGMSIIVLDEKKEMMRIDNLKTSIVKDYEKFKEKVEIFSEERSSVYENLNKINYLADIKTNYETLINEYKKYEETLDEIERVSSELKVNCFEKDFEETNINNKISAFIINYEQSINYFIQDVNSFNERVKQYNAWLDTLTNNQQYPRLEEYKSKYNNYVDVNKDDIYEGVISS